MAMVWMDERERDSALAEALGSREGFSIVVKRLKWGDYAVGRTLGIERKEGGDLARSIVDGRLFRQLAGIRRCYRRPLLLIEGLVLGEAAGGVSWPAIRGALISAGTAFGVPMLFSSGCEESAEMIAAAVAQQERLSSDGHARPGYRPKGWRKRALFILQGLPRVGPGRAAALLDALGSVRAVMAADERVLQEVRGIGCGVASGITAATAPRPSVGEERESAQGGADGCVADRGGCG